jgi:tetratricopeptide (TPR) repeat protein
MVRGKHQEAIPHLEEALRVDPAYERSKLNLGAAYANAGRFDEAAGILQKYLAAMPNSGEGHFTLGFVYAQQRKTPEAIAEFEKALQYRLRSDQVAQAQTHIGIALATAGKAADAEERFRAAIAAQPEFVLAHRNLAMALLDQKKTREAVEQLSRSIVQTRGNSELRRMQQELTGR